MRAHATHPQPAKPPGRKAEAAANDLEITAAAFDILTVDPHATMADIAHRAGVGVASLYRRYPTRQALVHQLCLNAMTSIADAASIHAEHLRDPAADPWTEFEGFITSALAAGAGAMRALSGTFYADSVLANTAAQMNARMQTVLTLAQKRGAVRTDITAADVTQFFEMLRAIHIGDQASSEHFRRRYLALFITALHPSAATAALPVKAPAWPEISVNWNRRDVRDQI